MYLGSDINEFVPRLRDERERVSIDHPEYFQHPQQSTKNDSAFNPSETSNLPAVKISYEISINHQIG